MTAENKIKSVLPDKMAELKLCKNCVHYGAKSKTVDLHGLTNNGCNKVAIHVDYINGIVQYLHAQSCRNDEALCGPEAAYFEESFIKK